MSQLYRDCKLELQMCQFYRDRNCNLFDCRNRFIAIAEPARDKKPSLHRNLSVTGNHLSIKTCQRPETIVPQESVKKGLYRKQHHLQRNRKGTILRGELTFLGDHHRSITIAGHCNFVDQSSIFHQRKQRCQLQRSVPGKVNQSAITIFHCNRKCHRTRF